MGKENMIKFIQRLVTPKIPSGKMSEGMKQAWELDILQARAKSVIDAAREEGLDMSPEEALIQVADFDQSGTIKNGEGTEPATTISQEHAK